MSVFSDLKRLMTPADQRGQGLRRPQPPTTEQREQERRRLQHPHAGQQDRGCQRRQPLAGRQGQRDKLKVWASQYGCCIRLC